MTKTFDVKHVPPGATLELYVSPTCPYCRQAIEHYDSVGTRYTCYDAQNDLRARERMFAYSGGNPTVPVIVIEGEYVQSGWGSPPRG